LNCWLATAPELLSVTTTMIVFVEGPCASLGVQEIAPEVALIVIPCGGDTSENVNGFAGESLSVAEADTFSEPSSSMVWFAGTASCGAVFTSRTVTVNVLVVLNCVALIAEGLLSVTITVIGLTDGPCPSVGAHVIAPLVALIVIPAGGETSA